jgi:hypothetical protein
VNIWARDSSRHRFTVIAVATLMMMLVAGPLDARASADSFVQLSGVVRDAVGQPVSGASVGFGSSGIVTGDDGSYDLHVVPGTNADLKVTVSKFSGGSPLSTSLTIDSAAFTVSADTVENVTLPAAVRAHVHVIDANSAPVSGATVAVFPSSDEHITFAGTLDDDTPTTVTWDATLYGGSGDQCQTDSTGACDLWAMPGVTVPVVAYLFAPPLPPGYPTQTCCGADGQVTFDAQPTDTTIQIPNVVVLSSSGPFNGAVTVGSTAGTALTHVSTQSIPDATLPPGTVALVGQISYTVTNVPVGGSADVVVSLPAGSNPTKVYKLSNGSLNDLTSFATFSGNTIVLHLTDGGPGDEDGVANGVIVDPIIPAGSVSLSCAVTAATVAFKPALGTKGGTRALAVAVHAKMPGCVGSSDLAGVVSATSTGHSAGGTNACSVLSNPPAFSLTVKWKVRSHTPKVAPTTLTFSNVNVTTNGSVVWRYGGTIATGPHKGQAVSLDLPLSQSAAGLSAACSSKRGLKSVLSPTGGTLTLLR